jgi:DNA-binding MarR family transcriptional regulator
MKDLFFRLAAFRETAGTTFLDTVWLESETAAQELGEDLRDTIFTALQTLGTEFGESPFTGLRADIEVTEGNLSSLIGKMEDAGCVRVGKQFVDQKPQTTYELTEKGEPLFEEHIHALESLIDGLDA